MNSITKNVRLEIKDFDGMYELQLRDGNKSYFDQVYDFLGLLTTNLKESNVRLSYLDNDNDLVTIAGSDEFRFALMTIGPDEKFLHVFVDGISAKSPDSPRSSTSSWEDFELVDHEDNFEGMYEKIPPYTAAVLENNEMRYDYIPASVSRSSTINSQDVRSTVYPIIPEDLGRLHNETMNVTTTAEIVKVESPLEESVPQDEPELVAEEEFVSEVVPQVESVPIEQSTPIVEAVLLDAIPQSESVPLLETIPLSKSESTSPFQTQENLVSEPFSENEDANFAYQSGTIPMNVKHLNDSISQPKVSPKRPKLDLKQASQKFMEAFQEKDANVMVSTIMGAVDSVVGAISEAAASREKPSPKRKESPSMKKQEFTSNNTSQEESPKVFEKETKDPTFPQKVAHVFEDEANLKILLEVMSDVSLHPLYRDIAKWEAQGRPLSLLMVCGIHSLILFRSFADLAERIPELRTLLLPGVIDWLSSANDMTMKKEEVQKEQEKKQDQKEQEENPMEKSVHSRIICDGCNASPILGVRYKSAVVHDFDLCEKCEETQKWEETHSPFLKIRTNDRCPAGLVCVLKPEDHRSSRAEYFQRKRTESGFPEGFHRSEGGRCGTTDRMMHPRRPCGFFGGRRSRNIFNGSETWDSKFGSNGLFGSESKPAQQQPSAPRTEQKTYNCPKDHVLTRFTTQLLGFECDLCNKKASPGSVMYGCRKCDWDCCANHLENDTNDNSSSPSHPVPTVSSKPPMVNVSSTKEPTRLQAKFIQDLSYCDGSVVDTNTLIKKVWKVQNNGNTRWPTGTKFVCVGGDRMGFPLEGVAVPLANPGEYAMLEAELTTPSQPGRTVGYFRLKTPSKSTKEEENSEFLSVKFGHRFWVDLLVKEPEVERVDGIFTAFSPEDIPSQQIQQTLPNSTTTSLPAIPSEFTVRWANELSILNQMGFLNNRKSIVALTRFHGDLESVIDFLSK